MYTASEPPDSALSNDTGLGLVPSGSGCEFEFDGEGTCQHWSLAPRQQLDLVDTMSDVFHPRWFQTRSALSSRGYADPELKFTHDRFLYATDVMCLAKAAYFITRRRSRPLHLALGWSALKALFSGITFLLRWSIGFLLSLPPVIKCVYWFVSLPFATVRFRVDHTVRTSLISGFLAYLSHLLFSVSHAGAVPVLSVVLLSILMVDAVTCLTCRDQLDGCTGGNNCPFLKGPTSNVAALAAGTGTLLVATSLFPREYLKE